jgi:hypothetical protein
MFRSDKRVMGSWSLGVESWGPGVMESSHGDLKAWSQVMGSWIMESSHGWGAPFVFVFVWDGGKCERFAFRSYRKNVSETGAP